jgi:tRNA-dihydrouridine synthase 3
LLDSHGKLNKMLRGMQRVLDSPVTVKFRTGIKDNNPIAQKLVPKLETWVCMAKADNRYLNDINL